MRNNVIKFLSSLNQVPFPENEFSSLLRMVDDFSAIDWSYFFELVDSNAVQVLTYKRLTDKKLTGKLPASHHGQLAKLSETVTRLLEINRKRNIWTDQIIAAFYQNNIPLVLLKGAYLGKEIYHDPAYKKMNDLDLLIKENHLEQGEVILKNLDFTSVGDYFTPMQFKKEQTHHTPPYIEKNGECVTGLHWNLISPYSTIKIKADDLFKRAVMNQDGKSLGLSPEDNLLHLCIHLPYFKTGLRELADVSNLVNNKKIDWEQFLRSVEAANAWSRVYRVLVLAKAMIHFEIPNEVLHQLKQHTLTYFRVETDLLASQPEKLFSSRSTYAGKIEKYFIVFKISNLWIEKMAAYMMMWWVLLVIPKKELKKLMSNRLAGSVHLWRALGLDHGENALILVTVANFFEMIKFTLKYPFSTKGRSLKHHPQYYLLKVLE